MARSERNGADRTSTEARARFRETAEQLAVRLRWLSIVAIPALAYLSAAPVHSPWFEMLVVGAGKASALGFTGSCGTYAPLPYSGGV